MFIHSVYFWLRKDLNEAQRELFLRGVNSLKGIDLVRQAFLGTPAPTRRPVIDSSYSYALTLIFDDMAAHDQYQIVDVHDTFREECGELWSRIQIYDVLTDD